MKTLFRNAAVFVDRTEMKGDFLFSGGVLFPAESFIPDRETNILDKCFILPGLTDVHVHLREPGFSYKETIRTGTLAAAHGGYTAVCAMPNLDPAPDSPGNLREELERIEQDAVIPVYPYGTITKCEKGEELGDLEGIAPEVIAFSDDGKGVQSEEMMTAAMLRAKALGKLIAAHCEDNALLNGGYIHDGAYAREHGHRGIVSESEYGPIARDLKLARRTGCSYHVCHVSAKESVELIRQAKKEGIDVTCETGPHYLLMNDSMLEEDGRFKMNPPIRSEEDRQALLAGILDGTIDMIITDHAPHSAEEKAKGLEKSAMGVVGLETAFPVLYTGLVKTGILTMQDLIRLMHDTPCARFGIANDFRLNEPSSFCVFDPNVSKKVDPDEFLSMGRSTPFAGWEVSAECVMTVVNGQVVYRKEDRSKQETEQG